MDILGNLAEEYYFQDCESPVIHKYNNTSELVFARIHPSTMRKRGGGVRGSIRGFSPASARRFRQSLQRYSKKFVHFLTITFPPECVFRPEDWRIFVRQFWQYTANVCRVEQIDYIWVREPHEDGRPHYHVLTNRGHRLAEIANEFVGAFVSFPRKRLHAAVGLQVKRISGKKGGRKAAMRYMAKIATYVTKKTENYSTSNLESYRHWARNYQDGLYDVYEASAGAVDWLRSRYLLFYPFKWPLILSLPVDIPVGPPLPF